MSEKIQPIRSFYEEAFHFFDKAREIPAIEVSFYPYIGINHTIRVRDGKILVRIAEICYEMPLNAQKALAYILVGKLLRKKIPSQARQIYSSFVRSQEMQVQAQERKRERGKKIITTSKGEFYDLEGIFEKVNQIYFQNSIPKPVLTWSSRKTFRILGHHDAAHQTIVISRSLDDNNIPKFVVEFVVFHEMLHIFHPTETRNGRRYNHTPEFRRNEKKFLYFQEAEDWIEKNAKDLKKKAKKR